MMMKPLSRDELAALVDLDGAFCIGFELVLAGKKRACLTISDGEL